MSDNAARYLGFAFASADLLFEIDPDGQVVFLMGAARKVLGVDQAEAMGRSWRELICPGDQDLVAALLSGLGGADRRGPVRIELQPPPGREIRRFGAFSACRLPQNAPNTSCIVALIPTFVAPDIQPTEEGGLYDRNGFFAATQLFLEGAQAAGLDLDLELIELQGLKDATEAAGEEEGQAMIRRVAAAMRSESLLGRGAARLSDEQFALVRPKADTPDRLNSRLEQAASDAGAPVKAETASLPLEPENANLPTMRALRFALDSFLKGGAQSAKTAFHDVLESTVHDANAFAAAVKQRKFDMVYQPVVDLKTCELQHFEALVRLERDKSPAEAIRLAEELELIEGLDLAVVEHVIAKLKSAGQSRLKLAANISARSLMLPSFGRPLLDMVTASAELRGRLIFEITETASFDNLDLANTAIQRLRQHGFKVCLDDFGAGAASMAYLRSLNVDAIKIDGQYVQDLVQSGRDNAVVRHLTQLCDELGVETIAEQIETAETAKVLTGIGVKSGQGWYFGRPASEPAYRPPETERVRRVGEVDSWR